MDRKKGKTGPRQGKDISCYDTGFLCMCPVQMAVSLSLLDEVTFTVYFLTPKAIRNRTSKSRWLTGTPPLSCFFIMKLCTVKSPAEYDEKGSHESLNLHSLL